MKNKIEEYAATVVATKVNLIGDRPVIFTTLKTKENLSFTHAVRLHHPQARRIGMDELRTGFPRLAVSDDREIVKTLASGGIDGEEVTVLIVPQMHNGIPVKLKSGEEAYNVRLRSTAPMTDDLIDQLMDKLDNELVASTQKDDEIKTA